MAETMAVAGLDVHARLTHARRCMCRAVSWCRSASAGVEGPVQWLRGLPGPVRACYEAGPTGFGLYRALLGRA